MSKVSFENPPVVERIIGVQFEELPFYTNAYAGWFWKNYLDKEWNKIGAAAPIKNRFERFGPDKKGVATSEFQLWSAPAPERCQIIRETDDRMIQLQNTRFLLNWRKREDQDYIGFDELYEEFLEYYSRFCEFVSNAGSEELKLNQWEITYINHIPKGGLWDSVGEWPNIFPGLSFPLAQKNSTQLDTTGAEWSITLEEEKGRLHCKLRHALSGGPQGPEIISLDLTARGPINVNQDFKSGHALGHETIVSVFPEMTSSDAHLHWGRK